MGDEIYQKLANVLDTLPNGFPPTAPRRAPQSSYRSD